MLKKLVPLCLIFSSAFCMDTISIYKFCREELKDKSPRECIQKLLTFETTSLRGIRIKNEKLVNLFERLARNGVTNPILEEQFVQTHSSIENYLARHFQDQKLRVALSSCLIDLNKVSSFFNAQS